MPTVALLEPHELHRRSIGIATTLSVHATVSLSPANPTTFAVKLKLPAAVGAPVILPVYRSKERPPGEGPVSDGERVRPVPPVTANIAL